jgi:ketosteroid isomerase-like protein
MSQRSDENAIRAHVVSLFDAYLAGDLETLRSGRTESWKGFQIGSTRLVRGLDQYMAELQKVVGALKVDRYEFVDFEIDIEGDLAIVYYLARDFLSASDDQGAPKTVLIRSIDIYRRIGGSWIQTGSNICAIPDPQ